MNSMKGLSKVIALLALNAGAVMLGISLVPGNAAASVISGKLSVVGGVPIVDCTVPGNNFCQVT
jgi:hypothetical protein